MHVQSLVQRYVKFRCNGPRELFKVKGGADCEHLVGNS